jgi:alpha-galactosidase
MRVVDVVSEHAQHGGGVIRIRYRDEQAKMSASQLFELDRFGVLSMSSELTRDDGALLPYTVDGLLALLPLPERAQEVLDFSGRWARERSPQRFPLPFGAHRRRTHRGKPGHDSPYILVVGETGFGFRQGEVWATHLAWSGEADYLVEKLPESPGVHSSVIGVGEALHPGEVIIAPGESYRTPDALFVWSSEGLDGIAVRMHSRLRGRTQHPRSPRPLVLNTWEAVYFDHDLSHLKALIAAGASVGVERVVLDDGWFRGRRDDTAGLGDWTVDRSVWPDGLGPLVEEVRRHGMQFGLWFEPEMVNLNSEVARAHPDWILGPVDGYGLPARNQHVLDIGHPEAFVHVLEQISALVTEHRIDYIKWDHNRDLLEAVTHGPGGRPAVHRQTLALYRMLDALRERHPALEIESCSGGGGRVDLGVLDRTDRLWPSDCNDPVERMRIERYTRLLVPPELVGSHLGEERAHTTSRRTDLSLRLCAALFAHAGIELDLSRTTEDLEVIRRWATYYREWRETIRTGRVVNADIADDDALLQGIIAADGSRALFMWARLSSSAEGQIGRMRFPGLVPGERYAISMPEHFGRASRYGNDPSWVVEATQTPVILSGRVLSEIGVPLPTLNPQQAMLIEVSRVA